MAGRACAALHSGACVAAGASVPSAASLLLLAAERVFVVVNAVLARMDDLAFEAAMVAWRREQAAPGSLEAASDAASIATAFEPLQRSHVRQTVQRALAQYHVSKGEVLVRSDAADVVLDPAGMTVHQYLNAVPCLTVEVVGKALWHYVALPCLAAALARIQGLGLVGAGGAVGTALSPGQGTQLGKTAANLLGGLCM